MLYSIIVGVWGGEIAVERRPPHREIGFGFVSCVRACGRGEAAREPRVTRPKSERKSVRPSGGGPRCPGVPVRCPQGIGRPDLTGRCPGVPGGRI